MWGINNSDKPFGTEARVNMTPSSSSSSSTSSISWRDQWESAAQLEMGNSIEQLGQQGAWR